MMTNETIDVNDQVVLTTEVEGISFDTKRRVQLHRGQVGTIVEVYQDGRAFEVEFTNAEEDDHVLMTLRPEQIMKIHFKLDYADSQ
jgi:hypothetical protein